MNSKYILYISPLYLITLMVLVSIQSSYAEETTSFPAIIGDDFKYEFSAPSRWESQDWQNLGWAALAVAGTSAIADRPVRDYMRQQPKGNSFLHTVEKFGQTYALGVMGGFYLAGIIDNDEKSIKVSQDLVAASMISASINQVIKVSVNRYRPRDNQGIFHAQGYKGLNNNSSFPSGHTTEAFTLASVIASNYEETWVSCASYSIAGMVGIARMYHDAHFASDVTASAFIGTWVGKSVVAHNKLLRSDKVVLLPEIAPGLVGIRMVGIF